MPCAFLNEKKISETKLANSCKSLLSSFSLVFERHFEGKATLPGYIQSYFTLNLLTLRCKSLNRCWNELSHGQHKSGVTRQYSKTEYSFPPPSFILDHHLSWALG